MATDSPGHSSSDQMPMNYIFHHVFLPPQLPGGSDITPENDYYVVKFVLEALREFSYQAGPYLDDLAIEAAISLVENTLNTMSSLGGLEECSTQHVLKHLAITGSSVSLHVTAQNAGVMIHRAYDSFIFETFELSPSDESINSTRGRLVRQFPATSIAVPSQVFNDDDFQSVLTKTLVKMSIQQQDIKPYYEGADQVPVDTQDTPNPRLVTELLVSFLRGCGEQVSIPCLYKKTREELLSSDGAPAWRRSPTWLLLRVSLQLVMTRIATDSGNTYKSFMLFFMTRILKATMVQASSPALHIMGTKILRRLLKLPPPWGGRWLATVASDLLAAAEHICERWKNVGEELEPELELEAISTLEIINSTYLELAEMNRFLSATLQSSNVSVVSHSNPTSPDQIMIDSSVPQFPSPKDVCKMELANLERSVLISPGGHEQSCSSLCEQIRDYHTTAAAAYAGNPEMISRMHLIILELWIALDQAAIQSVPLLQDYDPGIPSDSYHSLLLASRGDMERLSRAEKYLRQRRDYARAQRTPPVFGSFGHHRSLAVRYFAISPELQSLEYEIVDRATDERAQALEELSRLRKERIRLIGLYNEGVCERVTVQGELWVHPDTCVRCSYQEKANKLEIPTHDYPLPTNTHQAQAVIFELAVPPDIGEWRDITIYLIRDVLQCRTVRTPPAERPTRLRAYPTLTQYFRSDKEWRVSLQSTHKDHPSTASVPTCTEDHVLLSNNLELNYFDELKGVILSEPIPSHAHAESCSLPRPERSPMALTTLSSSQDRTMWVKMLSQLCKPKIDFNRQEIAIFVIHLSLQAGPNSQETITRKTHELLSNVNFGRNMLDCLRGLVARVEVDSGSYYALCAFASLAARLLSMTEVLKPEYTKLLGYCRTVSHHWMLQTREKVHTTVDEGQRTQVVRDLLHISLVCASTFCVEPEILGEILSNSKQQSILAEASIIIQDNERMLDPGSDTLGMVMCDRWRCMMHDASSFLESELMARRSDWLDLAVVRNWPPFTPGGDWCKAPKPQLASWEHHWVSTLSDQLTVHFNLRTGQLLVDEFPLSRIPPEYQQHPCYKRIFGSLVMDVMPSPLPGMRFSSTKQVAGRSLHFGMPPTTQGNTSSDLLVRLRHRGSLQDLIPSRVFAGILPHSFVHDFVHWYDHDSQSVELRPLFSPWDSDPENWRLSTYNRVWRLTKGGNVLVAPSSRIGQGLAKRLFPLHNDPSPIQLVFNLNTSALEIGMPQLGLSFELKPFDTAIRCHQFPGMEVDQCQSAGTLIGFGSKLVLRDNQEPPNRRILIPEGSLQWERVNFGSFAEHMKVSVVPGTVSRVQSYALPKAPGQLEGYVPLHSKLYLAFLHALTSHSAPDPLLGRTGTREAISILESADVRSTNYLDEDSMNMLRHLAVLPPVRSFNPLDRTQAVSWAPSLSFLSQDDRFHRLVHSLIEETRNKVSILPIQSAEATGFVDSDTQLIDRHISRHIDFQVTGSMPTDFTTTHDVFYASRGAGQMSPRSVLATEIASMIYNDQQFLLHQPATNLAEGLYKLLNTGQECPAISQLPTPQEMEFDSRWLQHPSKHLMAQWCRLHNAHRTNPQWLNKYQYMMWFATITYATQSIPQVTQALFAIFAIDHISAVPLPDRVPPRLSEGYKMQVQKLRTTVEGSVRPSGDFPGLLDENYRHVVNSETEDFCAKLAAQWPCPEPAPPSGRRYMSIDCAAAMKEINTIWFDWFENLVFWHYLEAISVSMKELPVARPSLPPFTRSTLY
ncbi:hypothetical protein EDB81DRAFT_751349 [Dactylonectria macrodidyma]|uniref:DUF6606 domain-containing protein n=1 Tax=Dactylonectria macrodidyma TaxID=307937 RepID=A0A9P9FRG7_9HYPO|nr:hypothetical protein EDB81DRAFT_751349 [Dactylonectria macrodidyma]